MAGERSVVRGIVLRESDSRESDKILTVLTGELGKITVVARGARSRRSRVCAATQLFAYSELVLSERHGWQYLNEGSTIELFDGVRRDVTLLSLAGYFAELTEYVASDSEEAPLLLSHLLNALYALGTLHRPPALVKAAFELKLMALVGFEPLFDSCARCGDSTPQEPTFDEVGGTLLCRSCADRSTLPLTHGALAAIRHVLYGDPKRLYSFTLAPNDRPAFTRAAERYTRAMLERDFSTLQFYKSIAPAETAVSTGSNREIPSK